MKFISHEWTEANPMQYGLLNLSILLKNGHPQENEKPTQCYLNNSYSQSYTLKNLRNI